MNQKKQAAITKRRRRNASFLSLFQIYMFKSARCVLPLSQPAHPSQELEVAQLIHFLQPTFVAQKAYRDSLKSRRPVERENRRHDSRKKERGRHIVLSDKKKSWIGGCRTLNWASSFCLVGCWKWTIGMCQLAQ